MIILNINGNNIPAQFLGREILNDSKLREDFVKCFKDIMINWNECDPVILGPLCIYDDIKSVVIKNLKLVLSKTKNKGILIQFLDKQEVLNNIDIFLDSITDGSEMIILFKELIFCYVYDLHGIISLLSDKIEEIYSLSGVSGIYNILEWANIGLNRDKEHIRTFLEKENATEEMKKIDNFLAGHIQDFPNGNEIYGPFDFDYFMEMDEFKKKIKDIGIDFFIKFPMKYDITVKECEEISKDIFGEFTTEHLAKMKFGQNDPQKAQIFKLIIDELLEQTKKQLSQGQSSGQVFNDKDLIKNIEEYGQGSFSKVYRVGNYVLKTGIERLKDTIPNHRRILQPIIKTKILNDETGNRGTNRFAYIIEVQNLVEKDWYVGMKEFEIEDILYEVYKDIRKDDLVWTDIKPENIGRLLRTNTSNFRNNVFFRDENKNIIMIKDKGGNDRVKNEDREIEPDPYAIGMENSIEGEPLKEGSYVILDSDCIEKYNGKIPYYHRGELLVKFEKKYQDELKKEEEYSV